MRDPLAPPPLPPDAPQPHSRWQHRLSPSKVAFIRSLHRDARTERWRITYRLELSGRVLTKSLAAFRASYEPMKTTILP